MFSLWRNFGTIQNIRNAPLNSRRILSEEKFKIYGEK